MGAKKLNRCIYDGITFLSNYEPLVHWNVMCYEITYEQYMRRLIKCWHGTVVVIELNMFIAFINALDIDIVYF